MPNTSRKKSTRKRPPAAVRKLFKEQSKQFWEGACTLLDSYTFDAEGVKAVVIFYKVKGRDEIASGERHVTYRTAVHADGVTSGMVIHSAFEEVDENA